MHMSSPLIKYNVENVRNFYTSIQAGISVDPSGKKLFFDRETVVWVNNIGKQSLRGFVVELFSFVFF